MLHSKLLTKCCVAMSINSCVTMLRFVQPTVQSIVHSKNWNIRDFYVIIDGGISAAPGLKRKRLRLLRSSKTLLRPWWDKKCFGTDSKAPRKCNFNYHDCGNAQMVGEIPGSTFRIDGYFSPEYSLFESTKVVVSQVAVTAEFKTNKDDSHRVRTQILTIDVFWYRDSESPTIGQRSQSDHEWRSAQDVDVWSMVVSLCTEGYMVISIQITIEGEAMAVWYFSRSHSVMSKPFDFTKVFIDLIHAPPGWMIGGRIQGNSSLYSYLLSLQPNWR